jgi:amidase
VAYCIDNSEHVPSQDTVTVVHAVTQLLKESCRSVSEARPPLEPINNLFNQLFLADGGDGVRQVLRAAGTDPSQMHPTIRWSQSEQITPTLELANTVREWGLARSRMLGFLKKFDVIICPASSAPAPLHDSGVFPDLSYTRPYNVTGWPAAVVRAGTSSEGLPIGIQIVAYPWREDVALAIAAHVEHVLGGWRAP